MKLTAILKLQKRYNFEQIQNDINSGIVWKFEGSTGRFAMECLKDGICFLPEQPFRDYYGNKIPNRNELEEGTTGTLQNSVNFWKKVKSGKIYLDINN